MPDNGCGFDDEVASGLIVLWIVVVLAGSVWLGRYLGIRHEQAALKADIEKQIEKAYWEGHDDGERAGLQEARAMRDE